MVLFWSYDWDWLALVGIGQPVGLNDELDVGPGEQHNISWTEPTLTRRLKHMLSLYRDLDSCPEDFDRSELRNFRGRFVQADE